MGEKLKPDPPLSGDLSKLWDLELTVLEVLRQVRALAAEKRAERRLALRVIHSIKKHRKVQT